MTYYYTSQPTFPYYGGTLTTATTAGFYGATTTGIFYGTNCFYLVLSLAVWAFFLVCAWLSMAYPETPRVIWLTFPSVDDPEPKFLTYIDLYYVLHKIVFLLTYLVATASFCYFFVNIISKTTDIFNWLIMGHARFHIVPLLCISALFLLGIFKGEHVYTCAIPKNDDGGEQENPNGPEGEGDDNPSEGDEPSEGGDDTGGDDTGGDDTGGDDAGDGGDEVTLEQSNEGGGDCEDIDMIFILDFVFTVVALSSLIYIYHTTVAAQNFLFNLLIRKGTYSSLMTLLIYNVFYCINLYGKLKAADPDPFNNGCGYAFTILLGLITLPLATITKDYILSAITFLIYIGIAVTCLKVTETVHYAGYIAIGMAVFSLLQILYIGATVRGGVYVY